MIVQNNEGFPGSSVGKEFACSAGGPGSIPGLGGSPGEGIRLPTPVFWPGEFPGVTKSWTRLSDFHLFNQNIHTFLKETVQWLCSSAS